MSAQARSEGFRVERRPLLSVAGLFGAIAVESPDLWRQGAGRRPGTERLPVEDAPRTPAVARAVADFGAAESFARAAQSFHEPYGFYVAASNLGRVVAQIATAAETYLEENFSAAEAAYAAPLFVRRGGSELVGELEGCERRTVSWQRVKDEPSQKIIMGRDTIALGALTDSSGTARYSGAVYVFVRGDGGWTQLAKLKPPSELACF